MIKMKAQSALEFMMTYGWALLLLTALIAGLVYVIPHPKALTPDKCIFGSAMPCLGVQLTKQNLIVVLRNGMSQTLYNVTANVTYPIKVGCNVDNNTLAADAKLTIICTNNGVMNLTDDSRVKMTVTYKKVKAGYDQTILGEIYALYQT